MIDPIKKEEWCKALESGEYKQGRGTLRTFDNEWCCLGVWYEVNGGEWVEGPGKYVVASGQSALLFDRCAFGLEYKTASKLANMNDTERLTFPQIAAWIRENL